MGRGGINEARAQPPVHTNDGPPNLCTNNPGTRVNTECKQLDTPPGVSATVWNRPPVTKENRTPSGSAISKGTVEWSSQPFPRAPKKPMPHTHSPPSVVVAKQLDSPAPTLLFVIFGEEQIGW